MLNKLTSWVKTYNEVAETPNDDAEWATTVAGLLIEAAMADGTLGDAERTAIATALEHQLSMTPNVIDDMIETARQDYDDRVEISGITRQIRNDTDAEERAIIMEMIWMVVLADGVLHDYEAQLMRRLAGLLYIDDAASAHAAKSARARLGLEA
ncbi:TerB family tellurite resistance protein [Candidatus Puniceispirillum sp.]|uniref:tellurite resistance TerB family protein n=1 Tax=Candidatus Puniceispirillum sp. TaxID=2026719 RepID=UPI003F6A171F